MRKTLDFDHTTNTHITKLEKIYNVNPLVFYSILDLLIKHDYKIGSPCFSHKTECVHLPDREKIYVAHIFQPHYEVYILDDPNILSNPESLKKYITLITQEKNFPHILVITPQKMYNSVKTQIEQYLPPQTDEITYTIAVITNAEFNKMYDHMKNVAIGETAIQLHRLM